MGECIGYIIVIIRDGKKYYYGEDMMLYDSFRSNLHYGSSTKVFETMDIFYEWWNKIKDKLSILDSDEWYLVALKEDFMHNHFRLITKELTHAQKCMKHYKIFEGSPK